MGRPVAVLLLDDGELDDVQEILDDLGMAYGRVRGGAIARNTPPPTRLLISTPRRIDAVHMPARGNAGERRTHAHRGGERGLDHAAGQAARDRLRLPGAAARASRGAAPAAPALPLHRRRAAQRAARPGRFRGLLPDRTASAARGARRSLEPRLPAALAFRARAGQAHHAPDPAGGRQQRGPHAARPRDPHEPRREPRPGRPLQRGRGLRGRSLRGAPGARVAAGRARPGAGDAAARRAETMRRRRCSDPEIPEDDEPARAARSRGGRAA